MRKSKKTQNEKNKCPYKERKNKDKDIEDICLIVKTVLALKDQVKEKYIRDVLEKMLWDITELDGKHNYKYKSNGLLESEEKDQHEHVFTKDFLKNKMIIHPELCEDIIKLAVSCGVTEDEHHALNKYDKLHKNDDSDGWERYKGAGIKVWNMVGKIKDINLDTLIEEQNQKLKELGIIK